MRGQTQARFGSLCFYEPLVVEEGTMEGDGKVDWSGGGGKYVYWEGMIKAAA